MDLFTQTVNEGIEDYLDDLVVYCLQAPGLAHLPYDQQDRFASKVRNYLYQTVLETFVGGLNKEQFSQIEYLDPSSPQMVAKIQQLAAQIPGLSDDIEQKLQEDMEYIKENSKLPDLNYSAF